MKLAQGQTTTHLLATILTSSALMCFAVGDDEQCAGSVTKSSGGLWGIDNCNNSCGTGNCDAATYQNGNSWISYCGCPVGGEPDCCHMVLVSKNLGLFLPQKAGTCGATPNGCNPGSCTVTGTTTQKAECQ